MMHQMRVKAAHDARPMRVASSKERSVPNQAQLKIASLGLAVAMFSSSTLIVPDKAEALSYQERMAAMAERRQQLEATKAEARGETATEGEVASAPSDKPESYLDKIQGSLSMKIESTDGTAAPEPAPMPKPFSFSSPKKEEPKVETETPAPPDIKAFSFQAPKKEEPAPAAPFSFSFGGSKKAEPVEKAAEAPKPAASEEKPVLEPKAFSFQAPKKEEPAPAPAAAAPEAPTGKPWWERIDEIAPAPAPVAKDNKPAAVTPKAEVPAPTPPAPVESVPAPAPAPAPAKSFGFFGAPAESPAPAPVPEKVPEVKKPEPRKAAKPEPVKATPVKEDSNGKKRKTNGFKLFMSQIFMFAGFGGLAYATVFKADELDALKSKVDQALLNAGASK